MRKEAWREGLPRLADQPELVSWLKEPDSLTARLQKHCRAFRVRPVAQGLQRPLAGESGPLRPGLRQVREVVLECDGQAVIFAHTLLSTARRGRLTRWLAGLGSRSLGSLLFSHPGFVRGPLAYCRLDQRHPLYQRAASFVALPPVLWARRSCHRLGAQQLMVTEVFLPAILSVDK